MRWVNLGVGITAISQRSGNRASANAIPVDTARQVMESLVRDGTAAQLDRMSSRATRTCPGGGQPRRAGAEGVLVTGVLAGGPVAQASLRPATW